MRNAPVNDMRAGYATLHGIQSALDWEHAAVDDAGLDEILHLGGMEASQNLSSASNKPGIGQQHEFSACNTSANFRQPGPH